MNSIRESEGYSLLHTWNTTAVSVVFKFTSARKDVTLRGTGAIVRLDDLLVIEGDGCGFAADLDGAVIKEFATSVVMLSAGVDPAKYPEFVLLSLGDMHRLEVSIPPAPTSEFLQ